MSFLRRLFGAKDRSKGAGSPSPESAFDPTILRRFEREIETWPHGQARIAIQIIKANLDGTPGVIDALCGQLTSSQLHKTANVLREIHGEPIEDDKAGTSLDADDEEADAESERIWREMAAMKIAAALEEKGIDPCHTFDQWVDSTGASRWTRRKDAPEPQSASRLRGYTRTGVSRYGVPVYLNPGVPEDADLVIVDVMLVDPGARAKARSLQNAATTVKPYRFRNSELAVYFKPAPTDAVWKDITPALADDLQDAFSTTLREARLAEHSDTNALPPAVVDEICKCANAANDASGVNRWHLIVLAHQYVDADPLMRQLHQRRWVASMVSRADFAPSPEVYVKYIRATYFSGESQE